MREITQTISQIEKEVKICVKAITEAYESVRLAKT